MRTYQTAVGAAFFALSAAAATAQGHLPEFCADRPDPPPAQYLCPSPYVEMASDGTNDLYDQVWGCPANRFVLARLGDFCLKGLDTNFPGWFFPDTQGAAGIDYREEILASVIQPCFETAVVTQGLATREDGETTALILMSMQIEDVETMVSALIPVAQGTPDPQARQRMYGRAKETCVDAMTAGTGGRSAAGTPAQAFVVEPDAILGTEVEELPNQQEVFAELVRMIRAKGWTCDSISAARKLSFSRGFEVNCNWFAYTYVIEDKGGQWVVTLE